MSQPLPDERLDMLEQKIQALTRAVGELRADLDRLRAQVVAGEGTAPMPSAEFTRPEPPSVSGESVLTGVAWISFILVVALLLRTAVDNAWLPRGWGATFGLLYACGVMLVGYLRCARNVSHATVFVYSGFLLSLSIVYELCARFGILSPSAAYVLLGILFVYTAVGGVYSGRRGFLNVQVPLLLLVALAPEFPRPPFVALAMFLCTAQVLVAALSYSPANRLLPVLAGLPVWFFWLLWATALTHAARSGAMDGLALGGAYFAPLLLLFLAVWIIFLSVSPFLLPQIFGVVDLYVAFSTTLFGLPILRAGYAAIGGDVAFLGRVALMAIGTVFSLSLPMTRYNAKGRHVGGALAFAAMLDLPMAVHFAYADAVVSSLTVSAAGLGSAVFIPYFFHPLWHITAAGIHLYAFGVLTYTGLLEPEYAAISFTVKVLLSLVFLTVTLGHYTWLRTAGVARRTQPERYSWVLPLCRVPLLLLNLVCLWAFGHLIASKVLFLLEIADSSAYVCEETILIHLLALGVAWVGWLTRNPEAMGAGLLCGFIGAVKVFAYDLLYAQGFPLVLNVFILALVAMSGSILWRTWRRRTHQSHVASHHENSVGGPEPS